MSQDLFAGLEPPKPPTGLRARVLARARHAAREKAAAGSVLDRLVERVWASRPLRAAWLAAALVLLTLNLAESRERYAPGAPPAASPVLEELGFAALRHPPEHTLSTYDDPEVIEALGV